MFSEPLEAHVTSLDMEDPDGNVLVDHGGRDRSRGPVALVVPGRRLVDGGAYRSLADTVGGGGHAAEGFFGFGVGDVPGSLAGPTRRHDAHRGRRRSTSSVAG